MKKSFNYLVLLVVSIASLVLSGCTKAEVTGTGNQGSIYGTVTDFATGEPVANANVSLRPGGETTLTGLDGMFEFQNVEDGDYSITVSKDGYSNLIDSYVINVKNGKRMRRDVQITRLYESFIVLVNGQESNTIDFGSNQNSIQITVFNNGTEEIDAISYSTSDDWFYYHVYSVSNLRNIPPNTGRAMNIELYRNRLQDGLNTGYLYLSSGTMSQTITVKANNN